MIKTAICILSACILLQGCANQSRRAEMNQNIIRENEHRIASLEESVTALNAQLAQLNNRVYEVRTRSGQKTNMVVAPIIKPGEAAPAAQTPAIRQTAAASTTPPADPAASDPAAQSGQEPIQAPQPAAKPAPVGKRIDPKAKPGPLPAKTSQAARQAQKTAQPVAPASGSLGRPEAGPSGQIAGTQNELSLPPAELPAADIPPVPQGNVSLPPEENPAIPIPLIPTSDISLPPESGTSPPSPAPAQTKQPAKTSQSRPAAQGEQAMYNAALGAARSGRSAEGIRLFRDYLAKYPNGRYAANADYWIGECLYSQGKYQEALNEFQVVNNSHPSHHKNADALLKAGLTLNKMGDKAGAAEKFRTLIANFPNSEAARRARAMGAN